MFFHAQIYKCFDDFNRSEGTVVTLQSGTEMKMSKAIILAILCDHPAAVKCCLCGSACPQCFTRRCDMNMPPTLQMRTPDAIKAKKKVLAEMATFNSTKAKKAATSIGVNMDFECGWLGEKDQDGFTPFGPDSRKDNIYQCLPQVYIICASMCALMCALMCVLMCALMCALMCDRSHYAINPR